VKVVPLSLETNTFVRVAATTVSPLPCIEMKSFSPCTGPPIQTLP